MSDRGFMFPRSRTGRASLLPPPPWHYSGEMLTLEYRTDPHAVAELIPPGLDPGGRGPRGGRGDLGRVAELLRHLRGAPRPGPRPVPGGILRHPLQVPGPALLALHLHLGRFRLRDGARAPPGLSQEAGLDLPHPPRHGGPGRTASRPGRSIRREPRRQRPPAAARDLRDQGRKRPRRLRQRAPHAAQPLDARDRERRRRQPGRAGDDVGVRERDRPVLHR